MPFSVHKGGFFRKSWIFLENNIKTKKGHGKMIYLTCQNGYFPLENRSLGPSEKASFTNFGLKGGATYKITGRHLIDLNGGYLTKAPNMRSTFANARQNNDLVVDLVPEKIQAADKKSKLFPKRVQSYADEAHATRIAPIKRISPKNISAHLFIVVLYNVFHLKRFSC